jgi:hypothetical protein
MDLATKKQSKSVTNETKKLEHTAFYKFNNKHAMFIYLLAQWAINDRKTPGDHLLLLNLYLIL